MISYIVIPIYKNKNDFSNKVIKRIIADQQEIINTKIWIGKPLGQNYCEVIEYLIGEFKYLCDDSLTKNNRLGIEVILKIYFKLYEKVKINLKRMLEYDIPIKFRSGEVGPGYSYRFVDLNSLKIKGIDNFSFIEIYNYFNNMFFIYISGRKFYLSEKWKAILKHIKNSKKLT
ncbi:hypothetical protein SCLARK_001284 [Spiroplasma clarkii]|uniref:hypothetical protein n=1 Tax=Spiroplasma clarkii TaxID=2139 RepID=UPI000B54FFA3|nr:hypothetical protein [Spiroplasma clarkii]ARU91824.1 hypothetical protein SCLARK_001284 [Spiroplasma clarkii]